MDFFPDLIYEILIFYNDVAIFLVFGFIMAGALHIIFPDSIIKRHLSANSFLSVIKATLFGIPLPICSCGVVPVAASLKNSGASNGSTIAFLISTPQVGADSFMITYSLLGWVFGIFRIVASLITALLAGILVNIIEIKKDRPQMFPMLQNNAQESMTERIRSIFVYIEDSLMGSIANPLLTGLFVAGFISTIIPDNFFELYMGGNFLSMLVMLIIGIPMYVCASASTPIAAALIMKGLSPGAALVFLLTGPATNAISITTIHSLLGRRSTVIYMAVISVASLVLGLLFNVLVSEYGFQGILLHNQHEILPFWLKILGSIVLTIMLLWHYIKAYLTVKKVEKAMENREFLIVEGMSCMHCLGSVKKAVEGVNGTSNVVVDLQSKKVQFEIDDAKAIEKVKLAIQSAGFKTS